MGIIFRFFLILGLSLVNIVLPLEGLEKIPNYKEIVYYNSGAQFRGGIKKYFSDVGLGFSYQKVKDENSILATVFVLAQHPQKKEEKYFIDLAIEYGVEGNKFSVKKTMRQKIEGFDPEDEEEIVPFLCLLSHAMLTDFGNKAHSDNWVVDGKHNYVVKITPKKIKKTDGYELSMVKEKGNIDIKFFMIGKPGKGNDIWKFRMVNGKISTTFEGSNYEEIVEKYKPREWFSDFF